MIGGTTYEEARTITLLNQEPGSTSAGTRLLLGGTCVHNSSTYGYALSIVITKLNLLLSKLPGNGPLCRDIFPSISV